MYSCFIEIHSRCFLVNFRGDEHQTSNSTKWVWRTSKKGAKMDPVATRSLRESALLLLAEQIKRPRILLQLLHLPPTSITAKSKTHDSAVSNNCNGKFFVFLMDANDVCTFAQESWVLTARRRKRCVSTSCLITRTNHGVWGATVGFS